VKQPVRFGSLLILALTALLTGRSPLAQGGSVPRLYIADGAWDSEEYHLVRMDDLTGKGWTAFGSKGSDDTEDFGSVSDVAVDSKGRIYGVDQERNRVVRTEFVSIGIAQQRVGEKPCLLYCLQESLSFWRNVAAD